MAIAGYNSSFLVTSQPGVAFTDEATATADLTTFTLSNAAKRYLDKSVAPVIQAQYDETQQIAITGAPTGGTFTLVFGAQTTAAINWNDSAATVQTRLANLSSILSGQVSVTGGPGPGTPYIVEFTGTMAKTAEALITLGTNSLTGGTSPSVSITRLQGGATWATITTGFTMFRCNARVVFAVVQLAGTQVRFHSGNYLPYTTVGEAASCEFSGKMDMLPADTFQGAGGTGAKISVPGTLTGTMKTSTWWLNQTRLTSVLARDLIVVSFVTATNNRYEGYCYASDCNIKADPKSLVGQELTFQLTDEFFNA
jgi:hypothetical protein